jgi:hypothetical protein
MKRDRQDINLLSNVSSKKIHYPIVPNNYKERIYRCTHINCNFIATTINNVNLHVQKTHGQIISNQNIVK